MSTKTGIEWTDRTWNPVTGCSKVSGGCTNCYAEDIAGRRFAGTPAFPNGFAVTLRPERLGVPLTWRKPFKVFVNSMSDLFHADVPDAFIAAVWCSMNWAGKSENPSRAWKAAQTFQILTKRHGRMRVWVKGWGDRDVRRAWVADAVERGWCDREDQEWAPFMPDVLPNVWLGISAEDQKRAELRIPALLNTPAAVRFVSAEPLIGQLRLDGLWGGGSWGPGLDWVIVGGESGPGSRPLDVDWIDALIDDCRGLDVAPFVKQLGSVWDRKHGRRGKGGDIETWPEGLRVREFPKAVAHA